MIIIFLFQIFNYLALPNDLFIQKDYLVQAPHLW